MISFLQSLTNIKIIMSYFMQACWNFIYRKVSRFLFHNKQKSFVGAKKVTAFGFLTSERGWNSNSWSNSELGRITSGPRFAIFKLREFWVWRKMDFDKGVLCTNWKRGTKNQRKSPNIVRNKIVGRHVCGTSADFSKWKVHSES